MASAENDRRPPPWSWSELLLACDLVVANQRHGLAATDPRVAELSQHLRQLSKLPEDQRGTKFRNPNGVARKTVDLATNHPDYVGGRTKGGQLDKIRDREVHHRSGGHDRTR